MEYSNHFLAYLELSEDLFFDKIPRDKISEYIEEALKIGKQTADFLGVAPIKKRIDQANIKCVLKEDDGAFFKVKFRAQFEYDRKKEQYKIILYKKSLEELAQANHLSFEQVKEIVLTHEFYHYLETKGCQTIKSFEPIKTFRLLWLTRKAQIIRLSEIAANAFTKEMLKLDNLPNALDYQYLIKQGFVSKEAMENHYQEFKGVFAL